jgi:hypothetical protein
MPAPKGRLPQLRRIETEELIKILTEFDWQDYGLDAVDGELDWAEDLARKIIYEWERLT